MAATTGADYSKFNPNDVTHWGPEGTLAAAQEWGWTGTDDTDTAFQRWIGPRWNGVFTHLADRAAWPIVDPFRLRVQKLLTVALRQITPDNGFFCNLSKPSQIGRGRTVYSDNDPLPMVAILEEPFAFDQDLAPSVGFTKDEPYELILQGFVPDEPDHPTDMAHYLMADVKRRLSALKVDEDFKTGRIFRFGTAHNVVVSVTWDGGVVRPADERTVVAHFWLRLAFGISSDDQNPLG